jgi:hypothetical protein
MAQPEHRTRDCDRQAGYEVSPERKRAATCALTLLYGASDALERLAAHYEAGDDQQTVKEVSQALHVLAASLAEEIRQSDWAEQEPEPEPSPDTERAQ